MNIIQDKLNLNENSIKISNKQITSVELKLLGCINPNIAFNFIEELVTNYLEFYLDRVKSNLNKLKQNSENPQDLDQDPELLYYNIFGSHISNNDTDIIDNKDTSENNMKIYTNQMRNSNHMIRSLSLDDRVSLNINPELIENRNEEIEYYQFRKYLDKNGKQDTQSFIWEQIKSFVNEQLNILEDSEQALKVIKLFNEFEEKVEEIKKEQQLKDIEIEKLKTINSNLKSQQNIKNFEGINLLKQLVNPPQTILVDLDREILYSRIDYCVSIKSIIEKTIKDSIKNLPFFSYDCFTFAPVKGIDRSIHKLNEYHKEAMKYVKSDSLPESLLYKIKDLLRCSVLTRSPAESAKVVECLQRVPGFILMEFNNGFDPKDSEGYDKAFDHTKYTDIKLILRIVGSHFSLRQDEILEVQIIQNVNIILKKLENKIKQYSNHQENILKKVNENAELKKHLRNLNTSQDENSASFVNESEFTYMSFVRNLLADYYPHLYLEMLDYEKIFKSMQGWKNGKYEQMFNRLEVLKIFKGSFKYLKVIQNIDKNQDIDFEIDQDHLSEQQKQKFKRARSKILRDFNFSQSISNKLGNWQIQKVNGTQFNKFIIDKERIYLYLTSGTKIEKINFKTGIFIKEQCHHSDVVTCLALDKEGVLYSGSLDSTIVKFYTQTGEILHTFNHHTGAVNCIAFDVDGYLYSGGHDNTIIKQDISTGDKIQTQAHHTDAVLCITTDKQGNLQSGSKDTTIIQQNSRTGQKLHDFKFHSGVVNCLALDEVGNLYSGSGDAKIIQQNSHTGDKLAEFTHHTSQVLCLVLDKTGNMQSGSDDNIIVKQNYLTGDKLQEFTHHTGMVTCLALGVNGFVQSGSTDLTIIKQDTKMSESFGNFTQHSGHVFCINLDKDGFMQSGSMDAKIIKQEILSGEKIHTFNNHSGGVTCLAFDDNDHLYSCGMDFQIVKQDSKSGQKLRTFTYHSGPIMCLILKDGFIQSGSMDSLIIKQDIDSGEKLLTFTHHSSWVLCIALDNHGNLQSGGQDTTIVKQNSLTGEIIHTLRFHTKSVRCLALDQDANLQSGSEDFTIIKQDGITGKLLFRFDSKYSVIAIVLNEEYLIAASDNGYVSNFWIATGVLIKSIYSGYNSISSMSLFDSISKEEVQLGHNNGNVSRLNLEI